MMSPCRRRRRMTRIRLQVRCLRRGIDVRRLRRRRRRHHGVARIWLLQRVCDTRGHRVARIGMRHQDGRQRGCDARRHGVTRIGLRQRDGRQRGRAERRHGVARIGLRQDGRQRICDRRRWGRRRRWFYGPVLTGYQTVTMKIGIPDDPRRQRRRHRNNAPRRGGGPPALRGDCSRPRERTIANNPAAAHRPPPNGVPGVGITVAVGNRGLQRHAFRDLACGTTELRAAPPQSAAPRLAGRRRLLQQMLSPPGV
jgi:hypothetical protein